MLNKRRLKPKALDPGKLNFNQTPIENFTSKDQAGDVLLFLYKDILLMFGEFLRRGRCILKNEIKITLHEGMFLIYKE
ncbi:hypothetical protein MHLP_02320 [Candidatus Mycoplasma haematolamae str. Purdue]|uniref:Uncharacterized protein n=1 Tax=Mycoplasma haematolamae (strain Purdue) TaxID=1212765 RepID=I7CJL0_MYCHA|nr:hypothetical protein MHLP_02320 [Candidatus Mycoplasma haematolamae str. Purdue]